MKTLLLAGVLALASSGGALAAQRTATIEVTGLYCASCPYIAAQAITDVASARIIDGFYDQQAQLARYVVEYDDEMTTVDDLVAATMQYGYPATLIETPEDGAGDS